MKKGLTTYKQFIVGVIVGAAVVTFFAWISSLGHEPFQTVPYIVRNTGQSTLVKTPKFTVLYEGVSGPNSASSMTIAGRNDGLSSLWNGGSASGLGASEKGIDQMALYDESFGVATFFVAGQIMRVSANATKLQVAGSLLDISTASPFIIVDKDKNVRIASENESRTVLASIDSADLGYFSAASPKLKN